MVCILWNCSANWHLIYKADWCNNHAIICCAWFWCAVNQRPNMSTSLSASAFTNYITSKAVVVTYQLRQQSHSNWFVVSRVDNCNALLATPNKLQSILNAAAKVTHGRNKLDHITPQWNKLHWVWISEQVSYKHSKDSLCITSLTSASQSHKSPHGNCLVLLEQVNFLRHKHKRSWRSMLLSYWSIGLEWNASGRWHGR